MLKSARPGGARTRDGHTAELSWGAHWLERPLVFFGGKGGVGKTTSAAVWALLSSRRGQRTLLVSTDPAHSTSDLLGLDLGGEERRVTEHLWALEIDPAKEAATYIDRVRLDLLRRAPERLRDEMERQVELARVTPGAEEAALFDRLAELALSQGKTWDVLVFDTAPTGHTLRLLTLPETLQTWIDGLLDRRQRIQRLSALWRKSLLASGKEHEVADPVEKLLGRRRRIFYQLRERLLQPASTTFCFVLTAERLPILETAKAVEVLQRHRIPVGGLVVNRLLPESASSHAFFASRREQEQRYLDEIDHRFTRLPRLSLPLLPRDVAGRESLEQIVDVIRREIS